MGVINHRPVWKRAGHIHTDVQVCVLWASLFVVAVWIVGLSSGRLWRALIRELSVYAQRETTSCAIPYGGPAPAAAVMAYELDRRAAFEAAGVLVAHLVVADRRRGRGLSRPRPLHGHVGPFIPGLCGESGATSSSFHQPTTRRTTAPRPDSELRARITDASEPGHRY